jgi:hypothetical protein
MYTKDQKLEIAEKIQTILQGITNSKNEIEFVLYANNDVISNNQTKCITDYINPWHEIFSNYD